MFKKAILILGLLLMSLLLSVGCSRTPIAVTVRPGELFTIGVGKTAQITGEDMTITFNEVIGDSRVPQNVNDIWEGVADSRVTISQHGSSSSVVLQQRGRTQEARDTFDSYTLTYILSPYPIEGKEIPPKDYRLTMTVTR